MHVEAQQSTGLQQKWMGELDVMVVHLYSLNFPCVQVTEAYNV